LSLFIDDIAKIKLPFRGHLIGTAYWDGLDIVPVILFAYLLYGIYINLMAGIYIEKKTKYLPIVTGIAASINIIGNFLLIPHFNLMGAAIATLFSYFVMMAGIYYFSQKYYKINYEIKNILIVISSSVIGYIMLLIFTKYFLANILMKSFILIIFISIIFISKIIDINSLRRIFKN
jgi:O-antigen/teichoic acid export membrane protein